MSENEHFEITAFKAGERVDKLVSARLGDRLSRAQVQALIKDGLITVDGETVKPGNKLKGGEIILVTVPAPEPTESVQPEAIPLNILYEDEWLAVIDKPAGMVVHPGAGDESGTLVSAMLARWPHIAEMDSEKRMGIVHRLDKDTSGLIVVALNDIARRRLQAQFQERTVHKVYLALTERTPKTNTGMIDAPIGRDPKNRKRMGVVKGGRPALTEYEVIDNDFREERALLRVTLHTGRTHQIRVHLAKIGCPLVGDPVYGFRKQRLKLKRQFLHAAELAFDHPDTGERLSFESPLPVGLQNILTKLR